MSFKVTIENSDNKSFTVEDGQTILDGALNAKLVIPYSCRNGSCRSCMGKVLEGEYENGEGSAMLLSQKERDQGITLFCETHAKSDLVIKTRDLHTMPDIVIKKLPTRVISMEERADDVAVLKLQLPSNAEFKFKAGQYVDFILRKGQRRSYSIANAPGQSGTIELHIRHMPGGLFTDHVFGAGDTSMKVSEILRMEGPLGSFYLRKETQKPIIFVATSTGFAPIKGMLEEMIRDGIKRPVHFYWGARQPSGHYMNDLVQQWADGLDFFNYIPVCSQPAPEDNWHGAVGHVQEVVKRDFSELSGYEVYACGNPGMTVEAESLFCGEMGLPHDCFFADAFTSEADKPENKQD